MKLYMPLMVATLGVGLITGVVSAQDQLDYTEMVEDLKVMCRIIDEKMEETFEDDYVKGGFFRRGGCQHLYLKGYGAVFLLDVRFPVAEKEMKVAMKEKKTDLWEKYEREIRYQHRSDGRMWTSGNDESYSKEKVDKLKEQLAYLVGEYGDRIGQLASDDTISFVVFGYSDHIVDLDVGLDFEWHIVRDTGDLVQQARKILKEAKEVHIVEKEIFEKDLKKLEELAEEVNQDSDEKVIRQKGKTIIIEEEPKEEIKDSQPKEGKRLRMLIPPMPPSLSQRFRGKPATTMILTFKRSQLEGKKGADWEALLAAAEGCEVLNRKGTDRSTEKNKSDIHKHRNEVYND